MKLIPESLMEETTIEIAAKVSAMDGFVAMRVLEDGSCVLIPPTDVYALSLKQHNKIEAMMKRIKEKK